jgi:hypothetical protein
MKNKHQMAASPQPAPKHGKRVIVDEVIEDLKARKDFGIDKYGTPLMSNNGRNALVDAYQEALDLCCYLKQALVESIDDREYGCHVDYMRYKAKEKDWTIYVNCVMDYGKGDDCTFSKGLTMKEECEHWREVTSAEMKYYEG